MSSHASDSNTTTPSPARKYTVGMAASDDYDGVVFTAQALLLYHDLSVAEVVVVDNNPSSTLGVATANFCAGNPKIRYVPYTASRGTSQPRNEVFRQSKTEYTFCVDPHVLLAPGAFHTVDTFLRSYPEARKDLIQGPLIYDDLTHTSTHFNDTWNDSMWGQWDTDPRHLNTYAFEIPAQGLGLFGCRTEDWLGFNRKMTGFGGEEWYVHNKYRNAGRKTWCLSHLKWWHRFGRPKGVPYLMDGRERIRNYVIGHLENGTDPTRMKAHFKLTDAQFDAYAATADRDDGVASLDTPTACGSCGKAGTVDDNYALAANTPSDINEHVPALKALAAGCDLVVEMGVRTGVSTAGLLAGRPKKLLSIDLNESQQARSYGNSAAAEGVGFEFRVGDSLQVDVPECDVLFLDTKHTADQVYGELGRHAGKVRKYVAFHDTVVFGERGEDGGPGLMPAIRRFLSENREEWVVKSVADNNHGFMVISRLPEDRKSLPSLPRMALNLLKSTVRHKRNGGTFLPLPLAEERLKACWACEMRVGGGCSKCGCPLDVVPDDALANAGQPGKAFYPTDYCPVGKWHADAAAGVPMDPARVEAMLEELKARQGG